MFGGHSKLQYLGKSVVIGGGTLNELYNDAFTLCSVDEIRQSNCEQQTNEEGAFISVVWRVLWLAGNKNITGMARSLKKEAKIVCLSAHANSVWRWPSKIAC